MTTKCELLVVSLPLFWGQTYRNQIHIWVCIWKTRMALSTREMPQPGEPNQGSQTLAQMWEVAGWGCLPSWHVALQCVCMVMCVFSPGRLYPSALCSQFLCWQMCLHTPGKSDMNLPSYFPLVFHGARAKWWALRSAEVLREAKNVFLKCSWMVVRRIYFYLPYVCTEASMHDFLLFLESFKHMVNRLSMGWNLLLQEMLLQIVFPLQCIEGFSCHPNICSEIQVVSRRQWPGVFKALWNPLGLQRKW